MRTAPRHTIPTPGPVRSAVARRAGLLFLILASVLALAAAPAPTSAQSLDLELASSNQDGSPGDTVTFFGRITNTTGTALQASEIFVNFIGYNPDILEFMQVLGDPDFALPNNTFSAFLPLFRVFIAGTAPVGQFSFAVALQDINEFTSQAVSASVTIDATSTVPEPASLVLFATGAATLLLRRRRRPA